MKKCGIYCITNEVNQKRYIGQSVNLTDRRSDHYLRLANNNHKNEHLQSAYNKYGKDAFSYKILEHCSRDMLDKREHFYIDYYKSADRKYGYNIRLGGNSRVQLTEEHKRKIAQSEKGKQVSKESREKMRQSKLGFKHTDKAKAKVSEALRKRVRRKESYDKMAQKLKGRTFSEETLKKMSEVKIGKAKGIHNPTALSLNTCKAIYYDRQAGYTIKYCEEKYKVSNRTIINIAKRQHWSSDYIKD